MPGLDPTNPIHPGCTNRSHKLYKTKGGIPRYKCPDCGERWGLGYRQIWGGVTHLIHPGCQSLSRISKPRDGIQYYSCPDCGETWTDGSAAKSPPKMPKKIKNPIHPGCTGRSIKHGTYKGEQKYLCLECQTIWKEIERPRIRRTPNPKNPIHPGCKSPCLLKSKVGTKQRYLCPDCGVYWRHMSQSDLLQRLGALSLIFAELEKSKPEIDITGILHEKHQKKVRKMQKIKAEILRQIEEINFDPTEVLQHSALSSLLNSEES